MSDPDMGMGMDPQQVRAMAAVMNDQADQIDALLNSLTGEVIDIEWVGQDHDDFVAQWSGEHEAGLREVVAGLRAAASDALGAAANQETTSARY